MPNWVVEKIAQALNDKGLPLKGAEVLILGLAYKKNVADMRESPSVEIIDILTARGAEISYSDPHVPVFPSLRRGRFDLASVPLTPETLRATEAALLLTNHAAFDYRLIADHAPLIVDTRGVFAPGPNIVRA
jgi:UDP-N-acetyl-D-glucosamine dehydrogenase